MADKYSTIQQHQPLRTPSDWSAQGRAFVAQMEEVLDDIYRRFGRLRAEDLGKKLREQFDEVVIIAGDAEETFSSLGMTPDGIDIQGNKYVRIRSGSTFDVDAVNFKIDSENKRVTMGTLEQDENGYHVRGHVRISGLPNHPNLSVDKHFVITDLDNGDYADEDMCNGIQSGTAVTYTEENGVVTAAEVIPAMCFYTNGFKQIDAQEDGEYFTSYRVVLMSTGGKDAVLYNKDGNLYVGTANKPATLYGTVVPPSSRAIKHSIADLPETGERLDRLEPVTFIYNNDPNERKRTGLIYEDTVDVMPEICIDEGPGKAINYMELVPMLLKEIQSLRKRVAKLEAKVNV